MNLIKELMDISEKEKAQEVDDVVLEGQNDGDLDEVIDQFIEQEEMYSFEGSRGVRNLQKLVRALDHNYHDINAFLDDNSGAIEAIVEWIRNGHLPAVLKREWADNIRGELKDADEK